MLLHIHNYTYVIHTYIYIYIHTHTNQPCANYYYRSMALLCYSYLGTALRGFWKNLCLAACPRALACNARALELLQTVLWRAHMRTAAVQEAAVLALARSESCGRLSLLLSWQDDICRHTNSDSRRKIPEAPNLRSNTSKAWNGLT